MRKSRDILVYQWDAEVVNFNTWWIRAISQHRQNEAKPLLPWNWRYCGCIACACLQRKQVVYICLCYNLFEHYNMHKGFSNSFFSPGSFCVTSQKLSSSTCKRITKFNFVKTWSQLLCLFIILSDWFMFSLIFFLTYFKINLQLLMVKLYDWTTWQTRFALEQKWWAILDGRGWSRIVMTTPRLEAKCPLAKQPAAQVQRVEVFLGLYLFLNVLFLLNNIFLVFSHS